MISYFDSAMNQTLFQQHVICAKIVNASHLRHEDCRCRRWTIDLIEYIFNSDHRRVSAKSLNLVRSLMTEKEPVAL